MKVATLLFSLFCLIMICGCNSIGNGISNSVKIKIQQPQSIEIEGDWHIEIICNAGENSVETVIDGNLRKYISIDSDDDELDISLAKSVSPMVLPILRIRLQKNFHELSLSDSSICRVLNFNSAEKLEIELDNRAVCSFNNIQNGNISAEINDFAKLSLKGKIQSLDAEIDARAVLEADNVENLHLEASDNSICRIDKCLNANVKAENNAAVKFKYVKEIRQQETDDADIDYPLNIPESLKQKKIDKGRNL